MPAKKTKKVVKKTTKPVAKKTTKPAVKKPVAKKTVAAKPVVAPVAPAHDCGCGCGHHCCCGGGHRFIGFCIKIVILCMVFLLGCMSAPWVMKKLNRPMMHNFKFDDNGCLVLESVKCPKLLETLATSDDNADGCISRVELKKAMVMMHKDQAEADVAQVEAPVEK